ncbi:MAG: hypothetical protein QM765_33340 [Myxococcales bacterium]
MRPSLLAALLAIACAAAPATGRAAESQDLPTLAVPAAKAPASFDLQATETVAAAVVAEARRFPVTPVFGPDLTALAGPEKVAQLVGCAQAGCLAGLNADFLLSTQLSEAGDQIAVAVDLLLVKQGKSMMQAEKKGPRSALATLAADAAAEVLMAIGEPTAPRAVAAVPEPSAEKKPEAAAAQASSAEPLSAPAETTPAGPQPAPTSASTPTEPAPAAPPAAVQAAVPSTLTEKDLRLGGYVLDGVGAAMLLGGVVSGAMAMTSWDSAKAAKTVADYERARDDGRKATVLADALYGIGGAVVAVGLLMTFLPMHSAAPTAPAPGSTAPADAAPAPVTLAPALVPGGAGLFVSGGF